LRASPSSPSPSNRSSNGVTPEHSRPGDGIDATTERPTGAEISVRDVVKQFDARAALRGVSLDVARGELLALLGPSGSGKTTLLRILAGLAPHESGSVWLGGRDASGLSVQERGVGFVFQHYALFRHMSIFDNVAYGLRVRRRKTRPTEADIRQRVLALLDLVQLDGLGARFPAQLSGGQRQRVALARALAIEPRVLLLDEPFGALDARVRRELRRWLRDIHVRTGQTTIFVTHDQDEAMELADRVAILNAGKIEQVGRPEDIYAEPRSAFIASFVGDPTTIEASVQDGQVMLGDLRIGQAPQHLPDGQARIFVRASDLALTTAAEDVPAIVTDLVWTSRGRRAAARIAGIPTPLEVEVPRDLPIARGQAVGLRFVQLRLFASP
jgi:sulfate transport system ATP-binding protein